MSGDWAKPSAFTPLLRRFGDERSRDSEDLRALYARVARMFSASPLSAGSSQREFALSVMREVENVAPEACLDPIFIAVGALLDLEPQVFRLAQPRFDFLNLKEAADLRNFLRRKEYFHAHETRIMEALRECLILVFRWIGNMLPLSEDPSPFTIPLIFTLPDPRLVIDSLYGQFAGDAYRDAGLFVELYNRMWINACTASGVDPYEPKKSPKLARDTDLPLQELVERFFGGTPLRNFFLAPVPLKFTHEERFSHMHVVGGSGAGKTTLLQNLILHDLNAENPPALVIVDSQGDLINKLSRLALFEPDQGRLHDRLRIITPKDIHHPPALNIFDLKRDRLSAYDEATKEQVVAGAIQTFDYLFAGLLGADLTAKQGVFFRFVARLMLALPETLGRNATILDMLALMDDAEPYKAAIASLPPIQRQFFERDFQSKTFAQTKEQIRYRLNAILENPTMARLFTSPMTKIDLFDELNNGGIILVDTAKDFLKAQASSHFGRFFISLVLQAVLERAAIPESERKPAFLIVDEAAAYFDSNIDDLLTEARKYKLGCVFAHQFLDQCTSQLRSSLAANTAIKFAGSVSTQDARTFASDMRTSADFILSQPRLHFAAHVRHVTPSAVSIPIPLGLLERELRMSPGAYDELRATNAERVSIQGEGRGEGFTFTETGGSAQNEMERHDFRPGNGGTSDPTNAAEEW